MPGNGGGSEGGGGSGGGLRTTHEPSSTVAAESKLYACGAIHPAIPVSSRPMPGAAFAFEAEERHATSKPLVPCRPLRNAYAPLREALRCGRYSSTVRTLLVMWAR